jgi:uncharacterized protein (TIGR00251 family)
MIDADVASLTLRQAATGVRMDIRVMPRSARTAIEGVRDGRLVVRVTAPPVDDAANEAVVAAIAALLDLPGRAVRIVSGATARNKTVEVAGLDAETLRRRIAIRS